MASFSHFLTAKKFPSLTTFRALLRGPLTTLSVLVYIILVALCTSVFFLLIVINNRFLTIVPARGGTLVEGVIGAPHFINPILATTATDKRLVALTYGSLMIENHDGTVAPMLAQSYTVSPDGKTYTITLLPELRFDDNISLTSDDIAFTVGKLEDSTISPYSTYWQTISIETPDPNTIVFTLPTADNSFLSHLTFGILPKHVWENIDDQSFENAPQNQKPIGAGPFKVSSISSENGIPTTVILHRNTHTVGAKALLHTLIIKTYANQSALLNAVNSGSVDFSYSLLPDTLSATPIANNLSIQSVPTDTTIALYRAPNETNLSNSSTVMYLNQIIDKNAIIATVEDGYGTPVGVPANTSQGTAKKPSLAGFSIAVENDTLLLNTAKALATQLQQAGINVSVKAFDPGVFQNNINNGTIVLFLAGSNTTSIPSQYSVVLPLYTASQPYIFNKHTHTIIPTTLASPDTEYQYVKDWYTDTDKLWKWFIRNNK